MEIADYFVAWRNSNVATVGSLGRRITIARFTENPVLTVAIRFSLAEYDDQAVEHHKQLTDAVESIPEHNLAMMGDFITHLDKKILPNSVIMTFNNKKMINDNNKTNMHFQDIYF